MTTRTSRTQVVSRPPVSAGIASLATEISRLIRDSTPAIETARRVANVLAPTLADPGLLTADQRAGSPDTYRQHVLYADPVDDFSIVSLIWRPGQGTCIHDHIAWCVVGVYQGVEESTLYRAADDGTHLEVSGHMADAEGSTSYFAPPGDIHAVCNSTDQTAMSIHVYGADVSALGSSIRRRYDLPVR